MSNCDFALLLYIGIFFLAIGRWDEILHTFWKPYNMSFREQPWSRS